MELLSRKKLCDRMDIGLSTLRELRLNDPAFPKPRKINGKMIRWISDEIDLYLINLPQSNENH
jgi:predicted DNA-binding transcriptional regulator AlpA